MESPMMASRAPPGSRSAPAARTGAKATAKAAARVANMEWAVGVCMGGDWQGALGKSREYRPTRVSHGRRSRRREENPERASLSLAQTVNAMRAALRACEIRISHHRLHLAPRSGHRVRTNPHDVGRPFQGIAVSVRRPGYAEAVGAGSRDR